MIVKKYSLLLQKCREHNVIYIYGAGKIGKEIFSVLCQCEIPVSGFIVSDDKYDENLMEIFSIPLYTISQITNKNTLVIVALGKKNTTEIRGTLEHKGFFNIIYIDDLKNTGIRGDFDTMATHRTEPLTSYKSKKSIKRINLVTDSINANLLLGGVATALIVATEFANQYDYALRIITREATIDSKPYKFILKANNIRECKETSYVSDFENEQFILDVTDNDIFFATSWWSAQAIKRTTVRKRFFYIIQEVETFFYPHGIDHFLCSQIMKDENIDFIINSHYLYDYFKENEPNIVKNGISFEPAFSNSILYRENFEKKGKHKLFFYARPNNPRNLYPYGLYLIKQAIKSGLFPEEQWEIYFAGSEIPNIQTDIKSRIQYKGQMSWDEYAEFLREIDLAISLMYTPHPSYPPYDVACSGGIVVSNKCLNKTSMEECQNIILSDLAEDIFMKNLKRGIALASNLKLRKENYYNSKIKRDWHESLQYVMEYMGDKL